MESSPFNATTHLPDKGIILAFSLIIILFYRMYQPLQLLKKLCTYIFYHNAFFNDIL